jgi:S-adenosylmethionine synthetase
VALRVAQHDGGLAGRPLIVDVSFGPALRHGSRGARSKLQGRDQGFYII